MTIQHKILQTFNKPETIADINLQIECITDYSFKEFSDNLCHQFNFINSRGTAQSTACMKVLRELEHAKKITLPKELPKKKKRKPKGLEKRLPPLPDIPKQIDDIKGLGLLLIETDAINDSETWNAIMETGHPQGAPLLSGRQLRYLVISDYGVLGGFSFSAASINLQAREKWIGWNKETKKENLQCIVNMSRFLIRSQVNCQNLASYLLGKVIQRLPDDFNNRYNFRPLLIESFVDTTEYSGTCYKAGNWLHIGKTQGRGRQDRLCEYSETIKDIYMYPVDKHFRKTLGLSPDRGLGPINVTEPIEGRHWAEMEFGDAPIGDKRLRDRLVDIATNKAEKPGVSYSSTVDGDWAQTKGYYRLIDSPDESEVTMENILKPHHDQTIRRMQCENTVLCLQDGCELNYNNLSQCEGLGSIGKNQTDTTSLGLHMHSTFVINTAGLPLGVLNADCSATPEKDENDKRKSKNIPIEEKKTFHWIDHLRTCQSVKQKMPHTNIISVMDREADFFELFEDQRTNCPKIDVIIRAKNNRKTTDDIKLFDTLKESPEKTKIQITIERKSARAKKSKQKASEKREKRIANVSIHYEIVSFKPPHHMKDKDAITVSAIYVRENNPPEGTDPIEWYLLTTRNISSVDSALDCVTWYCLRWRIEDWHRVLKSGCKITEMAHRNAERLKRAIAINLVIGWRIMLMTLLARDVPDMPAEIMFSDIELKVLEAYAKKNNLPHLKI